MNRIEFSKMVKNAMKEEHTPDEWKELYRQMVDEIADFYAVEACVEKVTEDYLGADELKQLCARAIEIKAQQNYKEPAKLSPQDQKICEELFGELGIEMD